jgi:hypothetical protein
VKAIRFALASALALSAAACCHAQQPAEKAPPVAANGIKHAVRPIDLASELASDSIPSVFEQVFCSAMFELNDKQVICADQVRAFMSYQRDRAMAGGEAMSVEQVARSFEAPREVVMSAGPSGDKIVVSAVVVDANGAALARFQTLLARDGGNLTEKARELAAQVVSVPQ